ncbi:MAG: tRNA (adenosine(37)-N6)-threonylcarbamoyltransferase complex ATPase subunit type 1 TsaE [Dinoroseobacter sp.]|nr:tRNA (adenosine(37)-N6)-threonylcarbamoyltransferase complex ATPase subunit type 1 TsaE [Dinoroseobacter sp.]
MLTDPAHSEAFAKSLAPVLRAGDTLLLAGNIGAGKSFLSRAIIQARLMAEGRFEDVPSPTFTLVQVYELSNVDIWHCDLYRLTSVDEVLELGLEEAFETAICLVEWPDRLEDMTPEDALLISLNASASQENSRDVVISYGSGDWMQRLPPVIEAIRS